MNATSKMKAINNQIQGRPLIAKICIWLLILFILLNTVGVFVFFVGGAIAATLGPIFMILQPIIYTLGLLLLLGRDGGGMNIIRTFRNKATADFNRSEDSASGGYIYNVTPARVSWMVILVLIPFFLALEGALIGVVYQSGSGAINTVTAIVSLFYAGMVAIFILPGSNLRAPAQIKISPSGIAFGEREIPLTQIDDIAMGFQGLEVAQTPVGSDNVPVSSMVGRGLGNRQASRCYTVSLRADGESRREIIAGGLTQECAENLAKDLKKSVEKFSSSGAM